MYMNPLTVQRPKLQSAVLKFFLAEAYNFEAVTLLGGTGGAERFLDVGTVVGQNSPSAGGTWSVAAAVAGAGGNTGNGTVALASTPYVAGSVQLGTYEIVATSATEWDAFDPNGKFLGIAKNGTAFATQIAFTITAGGTAFVAGDAFTFAVTNAGGGGQYSALNLSGTDGTQNVAGIVVKAATAQNGVDNVSGMTVLVRGPAVVDQDNLIWPSGITNTQQTAALAQIAALGIVVRAQ